MSESLDRTKRALDLIPFILEHQGITLDELAKRFNISTEILYEDLNLLFCCGLPGYTPLELIDMNFEDGLVSVSNPQELDLPRKLTKQELLRLHLGLSLCIKFSPVNLITRIQRLQSEIGKLLSESIPVEIVSESDEKLIRTLVDAIQEQKMISFSYASAKSDSVSNRKVAPILISVGLKNTFLEGIEFGSEEVKSFRLDRMKNLNLLDEKIPPLNPSKNKPQNADLQLFVDSRAQGFLSDNSPIILESHEVENGYRLTVRDVSENWLISEIFAYGGLVQVLEPKNLRERIIEIAKSRLASV